MAENWPGYKSDERVVELYRRGSFLTHVTSGPVTHYYREPVIDSFDASHHTLREDGLSDFEIVAHGSPKVALARVVERTVKARQLISTIRRDIYRERGENCVYEPDWPKLRRAA